MEREKDRIYLGEKTSSDRPGTLRFWKLVVAALFLLGLVSAYVLYVPLEQGGRQWLWLAAVLGLTVCGLFSLLPKLAGYGEWILLGAGAAIGLIVGTERLTAGFFGSLNYLISWWNVRFEDGKRLFSAEGITEQSLNAFSVVFVCILTALVWRWVRKGKKGWLLALVSLFLLPGFVLNRFSAEACSLLVTACMGSFFVDTKGGSRGQHVGWCTACGAILLFFAAMSGETQSVFVDHARRDAAVFSQKLWYGEDTLPQGVLANAPNMLTKNEETLLIHTEQVKRLYLRGFVGDRYENGRWLPLKKSAFGGNQTGILDWLEQWGLEPAGQFAEYQTLGQTKDWKANQVSVRNTGAMRKYLYLPYSAERPEGAHPIQDARFGRFELFGVKEYAFTEVSGSQPSELLYLDDWFHAPEQGEQEQYVQAETVYRNFVYENYTQVSPDLEGLMDRLFVQGAEPEAKGIYGVTQRIRSVLSERSAYRTRPGEIPADEDPVHWFLMEGREGNAALFAAAGAQAYRAFGIPARYVEGYLMTEGQSTASRDGTVRLTNQNSHAWVEVYMDGIGWLPVDVTPGFYFDTYTLMEMLEHPEDVQRTAALEEGEEGAGEVEGEENTGREGRRETDVSRELLWAAVLFLAVLCVLVSAVIFLSELHRFYLLWYIPRRMEQMKPEERIGLLCQIISRLMASMGFLIQPGWKAEETEAALCAINPAFSPGEYKRVNDLMEKYMYGDRALRLHEERTLAFFAEKLYQEGSQDHFWKRIAMGYRIGFMKIK